MSAGAITAVIPHWYEDRYPVLCEAIEALHSGTVPPARVIVWDNTNTLAPFKGAEIIRSTINVGPPARFLAALLAQTPWIWFQDNDVVVQPKTLENVARYASAVGKTKPFAIWTLDGRVIPPTTAPYKHWPKIHGHAVTEPTRVTVSLGRGELAPAIVVKWIMSHLPWGTDWRMDDLYWSAALGRQGHARYVVPTVAGESSLTERKVRGTGMCHEPGFYDERDQLVQQLWGA